MPRERSVRQHVSRKSKENVHVTDEGRGPGGGPEGPRAELRSRGLPPDGGPGAEARPRIVKQSRAVIHLSLEQRAR